MPTLLSLLQRATAAKKDQLVVLKEYDRAEVAEAVEKLARETNKPVHRVDLSAVVSRYIGETEKSLQSILEKAKGTEAILFFDEADALFGKRTDVKDAHDRYANRKTNYLLQKMEAHDGLVLVAASKKTNLDKPFLRRLRNIVRK
ncbi:MAG TPA: ATP-binding protein [Flavisolibacter sp.]|jgi:SpoVK/Ycf46/Vps4 family AAA+-type ATPase|nr:ATP-binding protein [Flavisolibacter sp.]